MVLFPVLLLVGCGSAEHEDLKQWMAEQSKDMHDTLKAPPPLVRPAIVSYSSAALAAPFAPEKINVKEVGITDKSSPNNDRPPEYLEGFPLESLRLIGIIKYEGKMFGLVQTPEKPKHVTVGNYIGANFGRITEITKTEMRITENVKDANDLWVKKEKIMHLQQDEGSGK